MFYKKNGVFEGLKRNFAIKEWFLQPKMLKTSFKVEVCISQIAHNLPHKLCSYAQGEGTMSQTCRNLHKLPHNLCRFVLCLCNLTKNCIIYAVLHHAHAASHREPVTIRKLHKGLHNLCSPLMQFHKVFIMSWQKISS